MTTVTGTKMTIMPITIIVILSSTIFRLNVGLLYLAALSVLGPAPAIAKLTLAPLRG